MTAKAKKKWVIQYPSDKITVNVTDEIVRIAVPCSQNECVLALAFRRHTIIGPLVYKVRVKRGRTKVWLKDGRILVWKTPIRLADFDTTGAWLYGTGEFDFMPLVIKEGSAEDKRKWREYDEKRRKRDRSRNSVDRHLRPRRETNVLGDQCPSVRTSPKGN